MSTHPRFNCVYREERGGDWLVQESFTMNFFKRDTKKMLPCTRIWLCVCEEITSKCGWLELVGGSTLEKTAGPLNKDGDFRIILKFVIPPFIFTKYQIFFFFFENLKFEFKSWVEKRTKIQSKSIVSYLTFFKPIKWPFVHMIIHNIIFIKKI